MRYFPLICFLTLSAITVYGEDPAVDAPPASSFPTRGLLPKEEIGALRFLEQFPEADGRDVVVAIFDTGVDPGAAGLQTTPDGQPKIIDLIDATGSGDVLTNTVRSVEDGELEGLSGRTLNFGESTPPAASEYHLGLAFAYELFPDALVSRLKTERKKEFQTQQVAIEERLQRELAAFDAAHPSPKSEEKRRREELVTRIEQLRALEKNLEDPGPMFDCVVYRDGDVWRAIVDTDADGDLADEKRLTDFRSEREYGTFPGSAMVNFAVNIYEEGNRLSIVIDSGAHGTHVAGIVSAHFPDRPELNGIAPGAQIVSVKIGDTRLEGMETGAALVRGLHAVVDHKCDLINMSYGEPTQTANRGRLVELFSELVDEHGVIFVASAGNAGPALTTVGAPGGTTGSLLGVGAYISPEMMGAQYQLDGRRRALPYTWTSRGPTDDGDLGVDIFAPGGAIAPVPHWTLNRNALMNGTSMASPNACGAIALLLSALKSEGMEYSPFRIRRVIQNTALPVQDADVFAQGPGLIQVDKALMNLLGHSGGAGDLLKFDVRFPSRNDARGLYLREATETLAPRTESVRIRPVFKETADVKDKIDFEMRVQLTSTAPWVQCGEYVLLAQGGRSIRIHVDPRELPPGAHYAEVHGIDTEHPARGPIFRIPVTLLRTVTADSERLASDDTTSRTAVEAQSYPSASEINVGDHRVTGSLSFEPGEILRLFIPVPSGATWANLTIHSDAPSNDPQRFVVHTVQLLPGKSFEEAEFQEYILPAKGQPLVRSFAVTGGYLLELCLAQYWSGSEPTQLEYDLTFHGLLPSETDLTLTEPATRVEVASPLRAQRLSPSASLNTHRTHVAPSQSEIRPLQLLRDRLPDGQLVYELVLTYRFQQSKPGRVTPRFPINDGLLYESRLGSQLWMLFDSGKQLIVTDDVWPDAVQLGKGAHTLRVQLRHEDVSVLEKYKSAALFLDRPLASSINLSIHASLPDVQSGRSFTVRTLRRGEQTAIYIAAPEKLPSGVKTGDLLLGTIHYGNTDDALEGAEQRPGGFPLQYAVTTPAESAKSETESSSSSLEEKIRDVRVAQLKRLFDDSKAEAFDKLAAEILAEHPEHLPVLVAKLHRLDQEQYRKERLSEVAAAADAVIAAVKPDELAAHYGTNVDSDNDAAVEKRKEMDRRKAILIDALYRKGRALGYMELPEVIEKHPIADPEAHNQAFEENFAELAKWVDTTDADYFLLHVRRERRKDRFGHALEVLNRHLPSSAPNRWHDKKRRDLYEELEWPHAEAYGEVWLLRKFRSEFAPF